MGYNPGVQSRGGEFIARGIESFGQSMGEGIERLRFNKKEKLEKEEKKIEQAKSESELAKASDAIAKNVPGFWDKIGMAQEEWKNLSARDRWGAVTGLGKAQVLEEGAAQLSKTKEGMLALKATQSALKAASAGPPGGMGPQQPMGERLLGQLQDYPEAGASEEFWRAAKALPNDQSVFRDATDRINADTGMMNANRLQAGPPEKSQGDKDEQASRTKKNLAAAAASGRPRTGSGNNAMLTGLLLRKANLETDLGALAQKAGVAGVSQGGWFFTDTLTETQTKKQAEYERLMRQIEVLQGSGMGGGVPEQGEEEAVAAAAPAAAAPAAAGAGARWVRDPKTGKLRKAP